MTSPTAPDTDTVPDAMIPSAAQNDAIVSPASDASGAQASGASSKPSNSTAPVLGLNMADRALAGIVKNSLANNPLALTGAAASKLGKNVSGLITDPASDEENNLTSIPSYLGKMIGNMMSFSPDSRGKLAASAFPVSGGMNDPSTPASPNPPPSNPSFTSPSPVIDPNAIIKAQVAANPPPGANTPSAPQTDSMGYPDAKGDVSGQTYAEAQPLGVVTWRDLPPAKQQQILAQNVGVPNVPDLYDQQAIRSQGGALTVPNSPDIAYREAMYGLPVDQGNTVDAGKVAQAQGSAMRGMMTGGNNLNGAFTWMPNPTTGAMERVPVPEGNQTGPTGYPKYDEAVVQKARDAYNTSHEAEAFDVTRTAYSQLDSVVQKAMQNPNPSRDLALLKTFAKIDNPTRGITESNVETEMMNPGYFPGEIQNMWNHVTGGGILTPQQRQNIYDAAKESYQGNVNSIIQYQNSTVLPQLRAELPTWRAEELAPAVFGKQPSMFHNGQAQNPAQGNGQALPTITSQAQFDALPKGSTYVGKDGNQWMKP